MYRFYFFVFDKQQQSGGRHPYYGILEKKQQKEVPEKPEVEYTKAFGKYGPGYAGQRRVRFFYDKKINVVCSNKTEGTNVEIFTSYCQDSF